MTLSLKSDLVKCPTNTNVMIIGVDKERVPFRYKVVEVTASHYIENNKFKMVSFIIQ